jgi:hypothetical protein
LVLQKRKIAFINTAFFAVLPLKKNLPPEKKTLPQIKFAQKIWGWQIFWNHWLTGTRQPRKVLDRPIFRNVLTRIFKKQQQFSKV